MTLSDSMLLDGDNKLPRAFSFYEHVLLKAEVLLVLHGIQQIVRGLKFSWKLREIGSRFSLLPVEMLSWWQKKRMELQ